MEKKPVLRAMLTTPEEDDDEERYVDATDEDDDEDEENDKDSKKDTKKDQSTHTPAITTYDGRKRDPQYSNAEQTCLWELIPFKDHYHPSVVKYATSLFNGETINDNPDLHHHTLMHFLDRFVYRNAKKNVATKGSSIMQPLANRRDGGVLLTRGAAGLDPSSIPMNSEQFWRKKVEQVPVDEIFFHKYFNQKAAAQPEKPSKVKPEGDEEDEEDQVWRAMMSSVPGGLDDDDDLNMDEDEDDEDDEAMRELLMADDDGDEEGLDSQDEDDDNDGFESETSHVEGDDDDEIEFMNASSMDEEDSDDQATPKKRTSAFDDEEEQKEKPKKKKQKQTLPTFASYEDYAALLDDDEVDLE
ncbi:unnamed protein product [Absidia cylindrospora]